MQPRGKPRTDYGTILLHWLLVGLLIVSAGTGLRFAADDPATAWIGALSFMLPAGDLWSIHISAGLGLLMLAFAYPLFLRKAGLSRRVRLDRPRLMCLRGRGRSRRGTINLLLYWALFAALSAQLVTGFLLYGGIGGLVLTAHLVAAIVIVLFPVVHVLGHWVYGGWSEVLRIFRPTGLPKPTQTLTPAELLARYLDEMRGPRPTPQLAIPADAVRTNGKTSPPPPPAPHRRDRRPTAIHAHPLMVAAGAAIAVGIAASSIDLTARDRLIVARIGESGSAPVIDGDLSDPAWRHATPVEVDTFAGANLGGSGTSHVTIRAVHDGSLAYFAFVWDDPTRSLKHLPLIKRGDGWHLLHEGYDIEDEDDYYEDKLAVLFSESDAMAGGGSAHLGPRPIAGKPGGLSGRGLHFTTDGSIVDIWHWKAARGGLLGYVDDNFIGPPAEAKPEEVEGTRRYRGGFAADPGESFYADNFEKEGPGGFRTTVTPRRLPKSLAKTASAMGRIDLDPNQGEPVGARWWMTEEESVAYSADRNDAIPVGTVIPGVLIKGEYSGDKADVRGAARWAAGRWTLEAVRRLETGGEKDLPLASGTSLWVAVFDHSQTRHTRHLRPVNLEVEE
jgi:hypothetical protein